MERKVEVVAARENHVMELALTMRQVDVDEVWAQTHLMPFDALMLSVRTYPDETFACLLDDVVVAMFGVVEVISAESTQAGSLWMLASDAIYANADLFHEHTAKWLALYRNRFDHISNWVDARNTAAVKWISAVGFTIHDPVPYGPDGLPFHYFEWRAN